ncbi:MAG TPA: CocE/NonD family hydrolase [Mycobacteriales bacterium]|jgi:predicted acyl esterase|nr:CocE/NonD family hydrolase [Mycobacteriales bacterium]
MRLRLPFALASLVVASALAVPSHAATQWVEERAYVPTKYGEMFVDFVRPATGKAPVVLHITPYRYLYGDADPTSSRSDFYRTHFVPQGYAVAYGDLIGTGASGGCWDYGGKAEAESGAALVEWLGTRSWSNGKVGMIGTSYDGAIQAEIATLAPKHLAAIVPQEPVTSWYDYNYDHAVTHNSNDDTSASETGYPVGTPDLFDAVLGTVPAADPSHVNPDRAQQDARDLATGCDIAEHETRGHYAQPEYTAFWAERDWALRASKVRAAVLMQHGWRDMNTKPNQFTRYWQNLTHAAERRAFLGQWEHADVFSGGVEGDWPVQPIQYLDGFFAKWLKGRRDKAFERLPKVLTQAQDGKVRGDLPLTRHQTSFRLAHPGTGVGVLGSKAGGNGTFVNSGGETSKVYKADPTTQQGFTAYAGAPVRKATRLTGSGSVTLNLTCSLPRGQVAATLFDVAPEAKAATVITLGLLDLRFRDSLAVAKDVPAGTPLTATVTLRPQDYVLAPGHHLVLTIAGSDVVWGVPDAVAGQQVDVLPGSVLRLPLGPAGGVLS